MANLAIELFLNVLVAFFVNFLGFGVISLTRLRSRLSFLERIVIGALISNYILMVTGTILGVVFGSFLKEFFLFYLLLSLFVLIVYINKRIRSPIVVHFTNRSHAPLIILICLIQLIFILSALMHPIHNSYDYVYFYGPFVKEMVKQNGIPTDIPYTQLRGDFAPGVLLTHAFSEMLFSPSAFRLVSYSHFLLSLLVVYLLARTLFGDRELGLVAAAIMCLMPAVFTFFSTYSVYTEMSLMFYIAAGIWCIAMALKTRENHWFALAGASIALTLLSKNVGIYGVFIAFSVMPLLKQSKRFRIASLLFVLTPVLFRLGTNGIINSKISVLYLNLTFIELIPLIAIAIIMYHASSKFSLEESPSLKELLPVFVFASLALIWYARNCVILGTPTLNVLPNSSVTQAELLYREIFPVQEKFPDILDSLRLDYILTFTSLGAIFLVPKVLGFIQIVRTSGNHQTSPQEKSRWMFVIFPMLSYMLLWLVIFYGTRESTAVRNGVILIPFLSIVAAYGLVTLFKTDRLTADARCFVMTLLLSLYLVGTFETASNRPSYLPAIVTLESMISPSMILWSVLPLLVILAIGYIHSKSMIKWAQLSQTRTWFPRVGKLLLLLIPLVALLSTSPLVGYFSDMSESDFDISIYQASTLKAFSTWKEYDIPLITYLAGVNSSSGRMVGFWVNGVYYFTGHQVLDPNEYPGMADIYSIVTARNATHMLRLLREMKISYIAIPTPSNSYYDRFVRFTYYCPFYNLALDEQYATYLGTFDMFELYKMKQSKESFEGILDIRLALSNDSHIASSPNMLRNHEGKAQSSYLVGNKTDAHLRVVIDVSGLRLCANCRFTVKATAIATFVDVGPELHFEKQFEISPLDDAMQIISFGPLVPRTTNTKLSIRKILIEVENEESGKTCIMEANPIYSQTAFVYKNGQWSIPQGTSLFRATYIYP